MAILIPFCGFAEKVLFRAKPHEDLPVPWFTGPIFASSGIPVPENHYNIEPYLFATANTAIYREDWKARKIETLWNINSQTLLTVGINSWLDFQITPSFFYNFRKRASSWALGDLPVQFDIQLYKNHPVNYSTNWLTAVKLILKEIFPLGKYRNFSPEKMLTEEGGLGSFQTAVALVWGNLIHIQGIHFMTARLSFQYTVPSPVHVKGFNSFGGGHGTNGRIYPGQNFQFDLGLEYNLSQQWALAIDVIGTLESRVRFKGKPGIDLQGRPARGGYGASAQYSLAPAIEYNWSGNLGVIGGVWFTVAGRNAYKFCSAVFALNYYK
ncbi:MAG: hypothetical protein V4487_00110 [Chlamydiota bacterium]